MINMTYMLILMLLLAGSPVIRAQHQPPSVPPKQAAASGKSFENAVSTVKQQLDESLVELDKLRQQVAGEKIPLSRKLEKLEAKLITVRQEQQQASRLLDSRTLDLSNLRAEIKARQAAATYLSNLLRAYIGNFESRLHIAELQHYRAALEAARLAPENRNLSQPEVYQTQVALVAESLERLHDALGGSRFSGTAVTSDGIVKPGTFVLIGPVALFRSQDGQNIGTAEQRLGSLEPAVIGFKTADDVKAAEQVITTSAGHFPFDPTLGNAHKIEATRETIWEHVRKGGPVMVPIFMLAGAALLVALYKWLTLFFLRKPSRERIDALLEAVAQQDEAAARQRVRRIRGPVGSMLATGVAHLREPRDLIEEVMYEALLTTRLRLQRMLPFIAVCATAAPLLGLLGTVTGIINTFELMTVFGTGDVKTLSSGISEALITTKFGLIVAIPSLLLHTFLSRKARSVTDEMEKAAIAFANQVSKVHHDRLANPAMGRGSAESPTAPFGTDHRITSTASRREPGGGTRDAS